MVVNKTSEIMKYLKTEKTAAPQAPPTADNPPLSTTQFTKRLLPHVPEGNLDLKAIEYSLALRGSQFSLGSW